MGGELVCVTTEGMRLREYLDKRLAQFADPAQPQAIIDFASPVICQPDNGDVYLASSVQDYNQVLEMLNSNTKPEESIIADGEMNLGEIAHSNALTLDVLLQRNPEYMGRAESHVPKQGSQLLIRRARPFLQVQSTVRIVSEEAILYKTIEEETDELPKGASRILQPGVPGVQQVQDDYIYIEGELERRVRIDTETVILQQPTDAVIQVGTREAPGVPGSIGSGGGGFVFPVPNSPYSSRGYAPGGHRGLDINAAAGTGIYACQTGTVVSAGWHYSWGYNVVIDHGDGVQTLYAHCSALYVSAGEQVGQGGLIAAVGSTGDSTGNHLHLELSVNGHLVDPVGYVGYPY